MYIDIYVCLRVLLFGTNGFVVALAAVREVDCAWCMMTTVR